MKLQFQEGVVAIITNIPTATINNMSVCIFGYINPCVKIILQFRDRLYQRINASSCAASPQIDETINLLRSILEACSNSNYNFLENFGAVVENKSF